MEQVVWLYLNWCSEDYGGNSPIGTARVCKVLLIGDPDCREKNCQGFVRNKVPVHLMKPVITVSFMKPVILGYPTLLTKP